MTTPLELPIQHWERLANGTAPSDERPNSSNCALCQTHYNPGNSSACAGCPVYEHTGRDGCEGTPFLAAHRRYGSPEFRAAAQVEADFLKALRKPTPLELSIAHWYRIWKGEETRMDSAACALCQTYRRPEGATYAERCNTCPVCQHTGLQDCLGTPYGEVNNLHHEDPEFAEAAKEELDFLMSLLPTPPSET
jgi:hypothetical protein